MEWSIEPALQFAIRMQRKAGIATEIEFLISRVPLSGLGEIRAAPRTVVAWIEEPLTN